MRMMPPPDMMDTRAKYISTAWRLRAASTLNKMWLVSRPNTGLSGEAPFWPCLVRFNPLFDGRFPLS
jgi:hypothetical protein